MRYILSCSLLILLLCVDSIDFHIVYKYKWGKRELWILLRSDLLCADYLYINFMSKSV